MQGEDTMDKKLIETLAKVIIAAGWADKDLTPEERFNLKDLIFEFQHALIEPGALERTDDSGLDSRTLALFEMYTDSPVDDAERERLVSELRENIWSEEDRELVLSALQSMIEADRKITDAEQTVFNNIKATIESVDTGFFGDLGRLLRSAVNRRSDVMSRSPNREQYFEDFLKNKVYYEVRRRLDVGETSLEIPDEELRKLSIAGGLLARVAQVDGIVLENEIAKIRSVLQNDWQLSQEAAEFVVNVAMSEAGRNFDYLRTTREFVEMVPYADRASFLSILFAIADADGKISNAEIREIRRIADYLLLSDNRVDEAHSKFKS